MENKNLELYDKIKVVPENAKKEIKAGRLQGMTDINPMWRIKTLTEQFGICGIGWKINIIDKWIEQGANGVQSCFVRVNLFIKVDGNWSDGIDGIGGSCFVANESKGLYTSDECFKMAYTDAISVVCKMLGMGADVYWNKDTSKYDQENNSTLKQPVQSNNTATTQTKPLLPKKEPSLDKKGEGESCPDCENSVNLLKSAKGTDYWKCKKCGLFGFKIKTQSEVENEELDSQIPF